MIRRGHTEEEKRFHNEGLDLLLLFNIVHFNVFSIIRRVVNITYCAIPDKYYLNRYLTKLPFLFT